MGYAANQRCNLSTPMGLMSISTYASTRKWLRVVYNIISWGVDLDLLLLKGRCGCVFDAEWGRLGGGNRYEG
jgi:hypothetical protein